MSFKGTLHAFPNPFNENVTISYELKQESEITLSVFDIAGRIIYHDRKIRAGGKQAEMLNAAELSLKGGVYFIEVRSASNVMRHKLIMN